MSFEAAFLLGYAGALLLAALGLHRLGRVDPSPWRGRVLAGYRRQHPEAEPPSRSEVGARGWPHDEQPRLHTGIAAVVAGAALVLVLAGVVRHPSGTPGVLLAAMALAAVAVLVRLVRALSRGTR